MAEDIQARVRATAQEFGIDPDFALRIANQESRFNPKAISPKGAAGVMQVMPATAKDLATRYGSDNIRQGVGYLKELGEMFDSIPEGQRQHFIAAAYNAGPTRVMDLMEKAKARGNDPYNIASLADFLPEETLNYVANLAPAAAPARRLTLGGRGEGGTTATTTATTTPAPERNAPLGQAFLRSAASEGERQLEAVRGVGQAASNVLGPGVPGEAGLPSRLGTLLLSALGAATPVIAPEMTTGGVLGETLSRTGAVPLEPETAAQLGSLGAGGLRLAPAIARGAMRLASPSLRGMEKAGAARTTAQGKQAAAEAQRAAELGQQEQAGARLGTITTGIEKRLQRGAAKPVERTLDSSILDPTGRPILQTIRETNPRAAEALQHFEKQINRRLGGLPKAEKAQTLYQNPDVVNSLLQHATPFEAAVIHRAAAAGQPLSKLPYTTDELASIGNDVIQGRSFLSPIMQFAMGGAGMGAFAGVPHAGQAAVAILAGRLGLKALDAMLGTRAGLAALRGLGTVAPGSATAARILAAGAGELAQPEPRRLQRAQ